MLAELWASRRGHRCIVSIRGRAVNHHWVDSLEAAEQVAAALDRSGADTYFAPAAFQDRSRKAADAVGLASFWLDIDCGPGKPYADWRAGLEALTGWCRQHGVPLPAIGVSSGSGLHVYWLLDGAYPHAEWLPVAQHLKQALKVGGVEADPARTADAASILRVPGTRNHKGAAPQPVRVLWEHGRRLSLRAFERSLPAVGPRYPVKPAAPDEWDVPDNYPPGDADKIAECCAQIREIRDRRGAVSEPFWRAGLSVLWRCTEREHFIHEWSKGDGRYDPKQTQAKAERTAGPATCAHFDEVNPGGCAGCPYAGTVTSPVQLATASESAEPEVEREGRWRPTRVGNFVIRDEGLFLNAGEGEEPTQVTRVPIWIEEVREKAVEDMDEDRSALLLTWQDVQGRMKRVHVHQAVLHDMRTLRAWLANQNLISAVNNPKAFMHAISELTWDHFKRKGARRYYDHLGWYEEGAVIGDTLVTEKGPEPIIVQSSNQIARLSPKGNVEAWKAAVGVLAEPRYRNHAFALLCGFASPLLTLVGKTSAVVSLVGASGAGKTLSARAALSIYGNPDDLMQGATSTKNAVQLQMEVQRHLPYLLDEVTQYTAKQLSAFVYMAANGESKDGLGPDRKNRPSGKWQLVPFITSNLPLLEFHQRDIQEAHRRRLLELYFNGAMDGKDGAAVDEGITHNYGVAAGVYLQKVAALRADIPALFWSAYNQIHAQGTGVDADRYATWTLTAALLGGRLAQTLGLIGWDPLPVVKHAMKSLEAASQETQTADERAAQAVREWLTRESRRICHWGPQERGQGVGELVDGPVARDYGNGVVAVHRKELLDMLHGERIPRNALKQFFAEALIEAKIVRLAPGTPGVGAYVMKSEKLGFTDEVEKQ